jgi:DNA replication regulator SLD2
MEGGGGGGAVAAAPKREAVEVPDSQVGMPLLGGFDDEGMYDSPVEGEKGRDGQPLRVFKKKGQKRTTRKVNIRPTRSKRPAPVSQDGTPGEEDDVVPETQLNPGDGQVDPEAGDLSDSEFEANGAEGQMKTKVKGKEENGGIIKKTARKVNELAHANFKRLKLRSKGGKGGPGHNSRFRRRR